MLKKFTSIKNIGRFKEYRPRGDVEFRRLNLLYSGNGLGKTTLCAILRSLQENDPRLLTERITRGQNDLPTITLLTENHGELAFKDNQWSRSFSTIAIYDSEFIHENIYSGQSVDHNHKRQQYRLIIGPEGVALAKRVDMLDEQCRLAAKQVRSSKSIVDALLPAGVSLEAFLKITPEESEDIDAKIDEQQSQIDTIEQSVEIERKDELHKLKLPPLPDNFSQILSRRLEDVTADVEISVQEHLSKNTNAAPVSWIEQGVRYRLNTICPFCAQDLSTAPIVRAYSSFFSTEYRVIKNEIDNLGHITNESFGETSQLRLNVTVTNDRLMEFWQRFISVKKPDLDYERDIQPALHSIYDAMHRLVTRKSSAPLEQVLLDDEFESARSKYILAIQDADKYNALVEEMNISIRKQKATAKSGDIAGAKSFLQKLKAIKVRNSSEAVKACLSYQNALDEKDKKDSEKKRAKAALDEYSRDIFQKYRVRLNKLLQCFGADFRIGEISPRYAGGHPSTSYAVIINDDHVDIGDQNTPRGIPSFRSTLSNGDRSSLALAFFIVQLENRVDLSQMIVVFDDPFTSQDRSRKTHTQQTICKIAKEVKQVFVTSHDPYFLKLIRDDPSSPSVKTLQLSRIGKGFSTIAEWDVDEEVKVGMRRDEAHLRKFLSDGKTGELIDIARKIRPTLEAHLRQRLPGQFHPNQWLGDFILIIRDAPLGSPLSEFQGDTLSEIEDINDYSKKFHHDNGSEDAENGYVDPNELQAFVERTLAIVGSS